MDNDPAKVAVEIVIMIAAQQLVARVFKGSGAVSASVAAVVMTRLMHELFGNPLAERIKKLGS